MRNVTRCSGLAAKPERYSKSRCGSPPVELACNVGQSCIAARPERTHRQVRPRRLQDARPIYPERDLNTARRSLSINHQHHDPDLRDRTPVGNAPANSCKVKGQIASRKTAPGACLRLSRLTRPGPRPRASTNPVVYAAQWCGRWIKKKPQRRPGETPRALNRPRKTPNRRDRRNKRPAPPQRVCKDEAPLCRRASGQKQAVKEPMRRT